MKLKQVRLKNFRGYIDSIVPIKNLNVLIGKNDVGKSTIIDALDIYFNDVAIDAQDFNVYSTGANSYIEISCCFEVGLDETITLDSSDNTSTTLQEEYLLNKDNLLEISKKFEYANGKIKKPSIQIIAKYPQNFAKPLICQKISELSKFAKENNITVSNLSIKKEIRKAIFAQYADLEWNDALEINIDSKDTDIIPVFNKFKDDLPVFMTFRSDRTNTDKDKEINDTTKAIAKTAVLELEEDFLKIKQIIVNQIQELANNTLKKLQTFDSNIAKELKTNIDTKSLDSLFSFTFNCDDGISFNKRGSGVKRLMLLSFFLAEAERKNNSKNIIYAIEEPETSQHPDFQILLIDALKRLSSDTDRQIILTTHTPEIVKLINKENLVFLQKSQENHLITIQTDNNIDISKVADTLGILPYVSYKGVIFVERTTDIKFLKNLNEIDSFRNIIDINTLTFIPLHGCGNVDIWIKEDYLKNTNVKCLYFKDRDDNQTRAIIQHNNLIQTKKREIENYIPISLVEETFNILFNSNERNDWDNIDIANRLYNKGIRFGKNQKDTENVIKNILQSKKIWDKISFLPNDTEEIKSWFKHMKDFFE